MAHACRLALYVHIILTIHGNTPVTSYKSACWLTSNPIALMSWSRVTLKVSSCGSEIFSELVITWSTTTPPDGLLMDSLTAGGWLQGRSVRFAALTNNWKVESVILQWTVSHSSFLLQLRDCALACKASSAWQVGVVGEDVDWEPVSVCVPNVVAAVVTTVGMVVAVCAEYIQEIIAVHLNQNRQYFQQN